VDVVVAEQQPHRWIVIVPTAARWMKPEIDRNCHRARPKIADHDGLTIRVARTVTLPEESGDTAGGG
jgi:hypothetical protein